MTIDKTTQVRNYVLTLLEEGKLKGGHKVPGARNIATKLVISFLKVQQAMESLAKDGILEICGRQGTFVQENWRDRILHENIGIYREKSHLPWLTGLHEIMEKHIPGLRFTYSFKKGMFEMKTTLYVQEHYSEYMDLSEILEEVYPDRSDFFEEIFEQLQVDGKLIGIPFSFSPRVIFFNPELFKKAGCDIPEKEWTWQQFIDTVRKLKKHLPDNGIINWHVMPYYWLNFVMRSGGSLFKPADMDNIINIDSPETQKGLELFAQLGKEINNTDCGPDFSDKFISGEAAMVIHGRQFMNILNINNMDSWQTVAMPLIHGGEDVTSQATDILCIRKNCTNMSLAKEYIKLMLSEEVQDYIGQQNYSIPIRKSSTFKSIDLTDPRDSLFATEMGKLKTEQIIEFPFLFDFIARGANCLLENGDDIKSGTAKLADSARVYMDIHLRCNAGVLSKERAV